MKYCYSDNKRLCVCGGIENKCIICQKVVSDCEWVCNWTYCAECFDKLRIKEE